MKVQLLALLISIIGFGLATAQEADMATEDTQQVVEQFLGAIGSGDTDVLADLMADDVVWTVPGNPDLPWIGRFEGRDAVLGFLGDFGKYVALLENNVTALVVDGENAVMLADQRLRIVETGNEIDNTLAAHLVVRNGQVDSYTVYEDSYAVSQAQTSN